MLLLGALSSSADFSVDAGRDGTTLPGMHCHTEDIQNMTVPWRDVDVRHHTIEADLFMRSVARAYDECDSDGSSDVCSNASSSVCCPFVTLGGKPRMLVRRWGVRHGIGQAIENLVFSQKMRRTLEIGMLQGNTAFHILYAHYRLEREMRKNAKQGANSLERGRTRHTNVQPDPFHAAGGVALTSIKRTGFFVYSRVVDSLSQHFLPAEVMCAAGRYDTVLVDGLHTFEQTLIDLYYSDLLLRRGGFLLLDDVQRMWPAVQAAFNFWSKNRRGYRECDAADFSYEHKHPSFGPEVTQRLRCWQKVAPTTPEKLGDGFVPFWA